MISGYTKPPPCWSYVCVHGRVNGTEKFSLHEIQENEANHPSSLSKKKGSHVGLTSMSVVFVRRWLVAFFIAIGILFIVAFILKKVSVLLKSVLLVISVPSRPTK